MCLVLSKPKNTPQGRPLPPEILPPSDLPSPVNGIIWEMSKLVTQETLAVGHGLSKESSTKVLRRPQLPQNGDKVPKFVIFWTISTIKYTAKFHYIKTVSSKVVAQSTAFRVVSIYLQGDDPFTLKSWLQVTYPLLKAASFDTFCLVAPQPLEIEKEVQLHLTRTRHGLSNKPSTKVLGRP